MTRDFTKKKEHGETSIDLKPNTLRQNKNKALRESRVLASGGYPNDQPSESNYGIKRHGSHASKADIGDYLLQGNQLPYINTKHHHVERITPNDLEEATRQKTIGQLKGARIVHSNSQPFAPYNGEGINVGDVKHFNIVYNNNIYNYNVSNVQQKPMNYPKKRL